MVNPNLSTFGCRLTRTLVLGTNEFFNVEGSLERQLTPFTSFYCYFTGKYHNGGVYGPSKLYFTIREHIWSKN